MPSKELHAAAGETARSVRLSRHLRIRLLSGLLVTSSVIGVVFTALLYRSQVEQLEEQLDSQAELQATALASELSRFEQIAGQITSRSLLRQTLGRFRRGEVDQKALIRFSSSNLSDAMRQTPDIVGISRLDPDGRPLVVVGESIPTQTWPDDFRGETVQLGTPQTIDGRRLLVVSAPIRDRDGDTLGIDLVSFDAGRISDIIQQFIKRQRRGGESRIAARTPAGVRYFLRSTLAAGVPAEPRLDAEVGKALRNNTDHVEFVDGALGSRIVVLRRIKGSNWVFVYSNEANALLAPARIQAAYLGGAVAVLTLIGILLTLLFVRPITGLISIERRRLQNLLQERADLLSKVGSSEARLQSVLDNTTAVIYLKDIEGRYLLINRRFEELFHVSREAIIGKTDHEIFPADIADVFRANDIGVAGGGVALESDEQAPHDDGLHDYISIKFPLRDEAGEIYGVGGVSTDITERKRAERELLQSQTRYRDLTENTHNWIWEVDATSRYTYVGRRLKELLGYDPEEILGRTRFELMPADEAEQARRTFAEFMQEHLPFTAIENVHLHRDGRRVVLETSGVPFFDDDGVFLGYRGADRDVTERKDLERREDLRLKILETVAQGGELKTVLDSVLRLVEAEMVDVRCAIDLVNEDGELLCVAASPSLPESSVGAISDGAVAGHSHDLPRSGPFGEWVEQSGFTQCWSERVQDSQGNVLGTFALCHAKTRAPQSSDVELLGQVARLAGIAIERNAAEEALKTSEERFGLAMRAANEGLWDWDVKTGAVYYSPRWKTMLGYEEHELDHDFGTWVKLVDDEGRISTFAMLDACLCGEHDTFSNEFRMRHKNGEWVHILAHGTLVRDESGVPSRMVGTHVDISHRKRTEDELKAHRENLEQLVADRTARLEETTEYNRMLFDTSPIGLVLCDQDGNLVDVNRSFLATIGYTETEANTLSFWDITPSEYAFQEEQQLESLKKTGRYGPYEKEFKHKDGHRVPVKLEGLLIERAGTEYVWSAVEDITERKSTERAMIKATMQAEAANRAKSEFLANMSHEIRTPLNAVLGLARIGLRNATETGAEQRFGHIVGSGEHLLGLLNDVLDLSKLEAGKLVEEKRAFQLVPAVEAALELVAGQARDKELAISVHLDTELPCWVQGDPMRMRQVLVNLLNNAVKFTDRGEVRLSVAHSSAGARFEVRDTGIGISHEQGERLFVPFEQADSSISRRFGGTGLGLAISAKLARMMGGEITVESELGRGSTFTLRVPLPETAPGVEREVKHTDTQGPRLAGVRVLAAEDVELNRIILGDTLDQEGALTVFANNGRHAVDRLEEHGMDAFDVVLMDVRMPVMDGYEATRRIREIAPAMPVIGLTAHALAEDRERGLAAGMVDYVTKPVDIDVLVNAVRCQLSGGQRQLEATPGHPPAQTAAAARERPPAADAEVHCLPGIDVTAGLARVRGRWRTFRRVLLRFRELYADTADTMRALLARGALEEAGELAHKFKGTGANLGATRLHTEAAALEVACRDGDREAATARAVSFYASLEEILDGLASLDGDSAPPQAEADEVKAAAA